MRGAAWIVAFVAVAGVAVWLLVARKSHAGNEHMLADLTADIERGGLADLGRAQALGRHLAFASPRNRDAAAGLAFANATLAADYGMDTSRETADALARVSPTAPPDAASVIAAAARALDRLHAGDREAAGKLAAEGAAAAADTELPHPLYALGRARARNGDLPGSARAFEAAIIRAPGFSAARVAWAEVQLDLGDAKAARGTLQAVLAHAPKDLRVGLLLNEAEVGAGCAGDRAACSPPVPRTAGSPRRSSRAARWRARCASAGADRAPRRGRWQRPPRALAPDEPRLLARIALALCQLGAIDRGAALADRARRSMAPGAPALAWADAAVSLGRGRAGALPGGRAARRSRGAAAGGARQPGGGRRRRAVGALDELGRRGARARRRPRRARAPASRHRRAAAHAAGDDPVRAFVEGLRARLEGKLDVASRAAAARAVRARRRLPRRG